MLKMTDVSSFRYEGISGVSRNVYMGSLVRLEGQDIPEDESYYSKVWIVTKANI